MFMSGSDPATKGLDEAAGVTALLLITAAPALGLILFGRALKTALTLALAFPAALAALFIAANIALAADNPVRASAGADVMSPIGRLQTSLGIAFSSRPSKQLRTHPSHAGPAAGARHSRRSPPYDPRSPGTYGVSKRLDRSQRKKADTLAGCRPHTFWLAVPV